MSMSTRLVARVLPTCLYLTYCWDVESRQRKSLSIFLDQFYGC